MLTSWHNGSSDCHNARRNGVNEYISKWGNNEHYLLVVLFYTILDNSDRYRAISRCCVRCSEGKLRLIVI